MKQHPFICLLILCCLSACTFSESEKKNNNKTEVTQPTTNLPKTPSQQANDYSNATFKTQIIDGKEGTFGYAIQVMLNGKTQKIRQPHKPGLPGVRGFDTKEQAQKVADFVVNKIKTKGFPPTVTPEELATLGVLE
jgi:hypothetical protein